MQLKMAMDWQPKANKRLHRTAFRFHLFCKETQKNRQQKSAR